jgi:hypothetical protein
MYIRGEYVRFSVLSHQKYYSECDNVVCCSVLTFANVLELTFKTEPSAHLPTPIPVLELLKWFSMQ